MDLDNHPTVIGIRPRNTGEAPVRESAMLDAGLLKRLCLDAGADDVGFVEIDRAELALAAPLIARKPRSCNAVTIRCATR
jgi:hypothetical protein